MNTSSVRSSAACDVASAIEASSWSKPSTRTSEYACAIAIPAHHLEFEVTDDGRGFDQRATSSGTGLQGIVDRAAATDSAVEVRSAPGKGTSLTGRIPVEAS